MVNKKMKRKKIKDLPKSKGSKGKPQQDLTPEELDKIAGGILSDPIHPSYLYRIKPAS